MASIEQIKTLGVYISNFRSKKETDHPFAEPGLFIINDKGEIQFVDISNGSFARPELETLLSGIEFTKSAENYYPTRGTFV